MSKTRLLTLAALACTAFATPTLAGDLHVREAWIPAYAENVSTAPVFLTLVNLGKDADRLVSARSDGAARVSLQALSVQDGELRATPLRGVALPPGVPVPLEAGSAWLQMEGLKGPLRPRATYTLKLTFEKAGEREVRVRVRPTPLAGESLDNLRTDPQQQPGQTPRSEGLDDALRSDPFLR